MTSFHGNSTDATHWDSIPSDESLLVAYLDDELPVEERQALEKRLSEERMLQEMLARLEENWRLLDLLERDESNRELVETTMNLVALQAEESITSPPRKRRLRTSLYACLYISALLLCFFLAFFWGKRAGDKNQVLRKALPVIEQLDLYLPFLEEDSELLQLLAERRLFLPTSGVSPRSAGPRSLWNRELSHADVLQHLQRLKDLDEALYAQFYDNYQKFQTLSQDKQRRLLDFRAAIVASPGCYELLLTLQNFHQWRKTLQSYEQAELRRPMPARERVEQIAQLKGRLDAQQVAPDPASRLNEPEEQEEQRRTQTLQDLPSMERYRLLGESPERILQQLDELSVMPH